MNRTLLLFIALAAPFLLAAQNESLFAKYLATETLHGPIAAPQLATKEDRLYTSIFNDAVRHGWGVVEGGTEHERPGPNFAGKYLLVQWGCGIPCMQAALIDGNSGRILRLPQIPGSATKGFHIPIGDDDLRTLRFHTNSRVLGIPNIGDARIYYYELRNSQWHFLKAVRQP